MFANRFNTLGCAEQADSGDLGGSAFENIVDRVDQGAAGGEHRVDDVNLSAIEVFGQTVGVGVRLKGFFVALDAQETNLRGWQQLDDALEHAEAGAKDRHDDRAWTAQANTGRLGHRRFDFYALNTDVPGCLVREQRHQFFNQLAEHR